MERPQTNAHWATTSRVAVYQTSPAYPAEVPFHPAEAYPEYPFGQQISKTGKNVAYEAVRSSFLMLELDKARAGTSSWNPLGVLIQPDDCVLLKPNLIKESSVRNPDEWEQIITHGSVVRAVLDFVHIALKGRGRVIIADGPQTDSDFEQAIERNGLRDVASFFRKQGVNVELLDLRRDRWFQKGNVIYKRIPLSGDPSGYTTVELGSASEFMNYQLNGRFYGADYNMDETAKFHANGRHTYILCRSVMDADVVINLPKLKTHKKTGVTLSLKNMVGINGYRNCLPHHTIGTPVEGGDEFSTTDVAHRFQSRAITGFKKALTVLGGTGGPLFRTLKRAGLRVFGGTDRIVRSGNWHGNDTAWRMVLDLNKSLFYFDGTGQPRKKPLRYLTILDGIVAGDGDGPMAPDVKPAGLLVVGGNAIAVDTVCTLLMGFDYHRIPVIENAWKIHDLPLVAFGAEAVRCVSNVREWNGPLLNLEAAPHLGFKPHFGWKGHSERMVPVCVP
jgi:uncharacterized protein (DUF362 family)